MMHLLFFLSFFCGVVCLSSFLPFSPHVPIEPLKDNINEFNQLLPNSFHVRVHYARYTPPQTWIHHNSPHRDRLSGVLSYSQTQIGKKEESLGGAHPMSGIKLVRSR